MTTIVLSTVSAPPSWYKERVITGDDFVENLSRQSGLDPAAEVKELRDVPGARTHTNLITYLETCWANHFSSVITPDNIWYTLMCEVALLVKAQPEKYRALFSTSSEKQTILVYTGHAEKLPLHLIIDQLRRLVPSDADKYLPRFSTTDEKSFFAFSAAFADAVSPYYRYSMYMCDFPSIVVKGTQADWELMRRNWLMLPAADLLPSKWWGDVNALLDQLSTESERLNPDFWKRMFKLDRCGSGHETEVRGWITSLFFKKPSPSYSRNFSTHASRVEYNNVTTGKEFCLLAGLFSSDLTDGVLTPSYGSFVLEKKPLPSEDTAEEEISFKVYGQAHDVAAALTPSL